MSHPNDNPECPRFLLPDKSGTVTDLTDACFIQRLKISQDPTFHSMQWPYAPHTSVQHAIVREQLRSKVLLLADDKILKVWSKAKPARKGEKTEWRHEQDIPLPREGIAHWAFHLEGHQILFAYKNGTVGLWEFIDDAQLADRSPALPAELCRDVQITAVDFTRDNEYDEHCFWVCYEDGVNVQCKSLDGRGWNAESLPFKKKIDQLRLRSWGAEFICASGGQVEVWTYDDQAERWARAQVLACHHTPVISLSLSVEDFTVMVAATASGTVRLWERTNKKEQWKLTRTRRYLDGVVRAWVDVFGRRVYVACKKGMVYVWMKDVDEEYQPETGEELMMDVPWEFESLLFQGPTLVNDVVAEDPHNELFVVLDAPQGKVQLLSDIIV